MASKSYDVDEAELICSDSNLKLKSKCSLKMFLPHGHLFPFSTIFQRLDLIISSGIWVVGGSMLQLSVQVSGIDFSFLRFEQGALGDRLRDMICEAEVVYRSKFLAEVADHSNNRSGPI